MVTDQLKVSHSQLADGFSAEVHRDGRHEELAKGTRAVWNRGQVNTAARRKGPAAKL